jgi:hypothetical protein
MDYNPQNSIFGLLQKDIFLQLIKRPSVDKISNSGPIAQLVEQQPFKLLVPGPSPGGLTRIEIKVV